MFKIWDFCSYHMRPFSIQDLKASLECEENVSISLINEIFGVIIKIYLAENRKGLWVFFNKIHEDDIVKVWPELLSKLRLRAKNEILPKSFYEWLKYETPSSFTWNFTCV